MKQLSYVCSLFGPNYKCLEGSTGQMEAGTKYLGPEVSNWARGPTMLHMFLHFSAVQLFVDCIN